MFIKWMEYPDDKARREDREGVQRGGQVWGDGPSPGTKWTVPFDHDTGLFVLVHMKGITRGIPHNYSLRTENR